ncbi:N-acetyltransferase [Candidimonas humi]|uniref:GNAT family N-acetyltransferase n=1 Tax=Candidimonas humi TaxID=683355 RepID=A0ABV8P290_9BURK|nr:GNAT family N-acetyltransferase [Candidimonas humi]MBV6306474.1 N-acetyltransferase [Candidimonas humi]
MSRSITHNAARHRYEYTEDGVLCVLDYELRDAGATMAILHTGVPAAVGGRGVAGELTRAALDDARSRGLKVLPLCSYAAAWIARHPDYRDLVGPAAGR